MAKFTFDELLKYSRRKNLERLNKNRRFRKMTQEDLSGFIGELCWIKSPKGKTPGIVRSVILNDAGLSFQINIVRFGKVTKHKKTKAAHLVLPRKAEEKKKETLRQDLKQKVDVNEALKAVVDLDGAGDSPDHFLLE